MTWTDEDESMYPWRSGVVVVDTNRHACTLYGGIPLKSESGYLMPSGTQSAPSRPAVGTTSCPWLIRARPGQHVNLTLFNLDRQQAALSVSPNTAVREITRLEITFLEKN